MTKKVKYGDISNYSIQTKTYILEDFCELVDNAIKKGSYDFLSNNSNLSFSITFENGKLTINENLMSFDDIDLTLMYIRPFLLFHEDIKFANIKIIIEEFKDLKYIKNLSSINNIYKQIEFLYNYLSDYSTMNFDVNQNNEIKSITSGEEVKMKKISLTNKEWLYVYMYGKKFHVNYSEEDSIRGVTRRDIYHYMMAGDDIQAFFKQLIAKITIKFLYSTLIVRDNINDILKEIKKKEEKKD